MAWLKWALCLTVASAQDLFLAVKDVAGALDDVEQSGDGSEVKQEEPSAVDAPAPTPALPRGTMPSLPMANAAQKGMQFPIFGLGTRAAGYANGKSSGTECWEYPKCGNTVVDATSSFIKMVNSNGDVPRIDTGYYFNLKGVGKGIHQSGVDRKDMFIVAEVGFGGPMGIENTQVKDDLKDLGVKYIDLCLIHEPDTGGMDHGQWGNSHCVPHKAGYSAKACRLNTWKSLITNWKNGNCKAIGVNNWNVSNIQELSEAGLPLPSVAQYKFHVHQSTASSDQKDLLAYCKKNNIILNGFSPLGQPDWVVFTDPGMQKTTLEEPKVQAIAKKMGKTAAQVMLRWVVQQGIATQVRTKDDTHMKEDYDIFGWELAPEDMSTLSGMPQCHTATSWGPDRGNPYDPGDTTNYHHHPNLVGPTKHC